MWSSAPGWPHERGRKLAGVMEAAARHSLRQARPASAGSAPRGLDLEIAVLRVVATALGGMESNMGALDPRAQPAIHHALHGDVVPRLRDSMQRPRSRAEDGPHSPRGQARPPLSSPPSATRDRSRRRLSKEAAVSGNEGAVSSAGRLGIGAIAAAAAASQGMAE